MTTYNTGNPLGSAAVKDLYDNAENLDRAVNDRASDEWKDRFGQKRQTFSKMERRFDGFMEASDTAFQQFLVSSGYQDLGDYAASLTITARNQIFRKDGDLYRLAASQELPYTTTGVWEDESGNFVVVGDDSLRQQLADVPGNGDGASMVGFYQDGIGVVRRSVESKLRESVSVKDFGAIGDGVADDTDALQGAFNAGGNLYVPEGTYRYRYLEVSTPCSLMGAGVLLYDGSDPVSGTASIQIAASIIADSIRIRSSGSDEGAFDYIQASADNIRIGLLEISADIQRNQRGGTNFYGSNICIDQVVTENVARPIAFQPPSGTTTTRTNIHLGSLVAKNYIRGLAISYADSWSVDSIHVEKRWDGEESDPGNNGVLLQACNNWTIGVCHIADAAEHSFRIGGNADTTNFSVGQITSVDSSGCALKFNVDPGYMTKNGQVGQVIGINTGQGSTFGNREVVRLTRVKDLSIGSITGLVWVTTGLVFQDVEDLSVGEIYCENVSARVVQCRADYDLSAGNINNIYIGYVVGRMQNTARAAYGFGYVSGSRTIGNVTIENSFVTGFTAFLADAGENIYSGPIYIRARTLASDPGGAVENVADTNFFQIDWTRGSDRYIGRAYLGDISAQSTVEAGQFVNTASVTTTGKGAVFLRSNVTAGKDIYGAGIAFSRLVSTRRGAAIVAKQTGTNPQDMGLSFLCGANTTSTDEVVERMILKHNGTVWFALRQFADNGAATTAGLTSGDLYRTASGEVRVVI